MSKFISINNSSARSQSTQVLGGKIAGMPVKSFVVLILGLTMLVPVALLAGNLFANSAVDVMEDTTGLNIQQQAATPLPSVNTNANPNDNVASGLEDYTGELKFFVGDELAGGGVASATIKIYKGRTSYDSLTTDSDGTKTSGKTYKSGDNLDIKVTSGSSVTWFSYIVPKVSNSFIQSGNDIGVPDMLIRLYTAWSSQVSIGGTSYDGTTVGQTNITGAKNLATGSRPGTDSFSISVSITEGTDNKGYRSSYDAIEGYWLKTYLHVSVNGTAFEDINITGMDAGEEKGSTMHYVEVLDDKGLSRWKVGNNYEEGYQGQVSVTMTVSLTGYNATSANIQFQVIAFANWDNFKATSSWGPSAVTVANTLKSFDVIN